MRNFDVTVQIAGLAGVETRTYEIKAQTEESARKKVEAKMGNRDHWITGVVDADAPAPKAGRHTWEGK